MSLSLISKVYDIEDDPEVDYQSEEITGKDDDNKTETCQNREKRSEEASKLCDPYGGREGEEKYEIKIESGNDYFISGENGEQEVEMEEVTNDIKPLINEDPPLLDLSSLLRIEINEEHDPDGHYGSDSDDDDEGSDTERNNTGAKINDWLFEKRRRARNWKWIWDKDDKTKGRRVPPSERHSKINGAFHPKQVTQAKTDNQFTRMGQTDKPSHLSSNLGASIDKVEPGFHHNETENVMEKVEAFKCPFCFAIFMEGEQLIQHLPLHTTIETKPEANSQPKLIKSPEGNQFNRSTMNKEQSKSKRKRADRACLQCNLFFTDKYELKRHMRIHEETDRPWKCSQCKSFFLTVSSLRLHETNMHNRPVGITKYPCKVCGKECPGQSKLASHMTTHSNARPFKCPHCSTRFKRKEHLKRHVMLNHQEDLPTLELEWMQENSLEPVDDEAPPIQIEIDQLTQPRRAVLESNIKEESTQPIYESEGQEDSSNLADPPHMNMKNNQGSSPKHFQCRICNLSFGCGSHLRRHKAIHEETEGRNWKCQQCPSFFLNASTLRLHENQFHNRTVGCTKSRCGTCGKLIRQSQLKTHMMVHTDERPYNCPVCDRGFRRMDHVNDHMLSIHGRKLSNAAKTAMRQKIKNQGTQSNAILPPSRSHQEDQFQMRPCRIVLSRCDDLVPLHTRKIISTPKNVQFWMPPESIVKTEVVEADHKSLIKAVKINGINRFKCTICGKLFNGPRKAQLHLVIHTNDRPYKCHICSKTFRWKENLFAHKVIHTGIKPHKCPNCSKAFAQRAKLNSHMRIHSGAKPYKCRHCSKRFRFSSNLSVHTKSLHQGYTIPQDIIE